VRLAARTVPLALLCVLAAAPAASTAPSAATVHANPCLTPQAAELRCPDLVMKRPFDLAVDRETRPGRVLLRAGNSIDSVGLGPAELHGVRMRGPWMRGRQRIYRRSGGRIGLRTGARLRYVRGHLGKRYWKFHHAAGFELWRLDHRGRRKELARRGAKVDYCLRDLRRTHPRMRRSPRHRVYPACSTNPLRRRVTLGTSVGWSDVYPPTYRRQYIDVTGLRGCFAYVEIADPTNVLYESDEDNNDAQAIVRLPYRPGGRPHCPGHSTGEVNDEYGPY
jgi:hypothetical protein